ncbi:MAG: acetate kinase [Armatimonadetes bacterium]|jgi:acetate kinase|nr:acetate kinase [Armatimonadota bacterium]MDI9586274.1 acetate kinase [Acidobacteriota bacterium]
MIVLVLNSGSSSIKYKLFDMARDEVLATGVIERVGTDSAVLRHSVPGQAALTREQPVPDHAVGIEMMLAALTSPEGGPLESLGQVDAVGHRVLHAAEHYSGSVLASAEVIQAVEDCAELAPLHNPPNLAGIRACQAVMPDVPHVCVFDNALHQTLPPEAYTYALPYEFYERHGVRRYGFHGIAFRSAFERARVILGEPVDDLRIVTLMMGSGNTANAFDRGRSVDVSTGFTPHEGLVQSTRAGDMDAALIPWLMEKERLSADEMTEIINRRSGWLGISGISADLRDVIKAAGEGHKRSQLALAIHARRARKYVGAYAAVMGGIDLLIFAGSVSQKAPSVRAEICRGLDFMGLSLDPAANGRIVDEGIISSPDSAARIVVVNVDEELVIARDTVQIVSV